MIRKFGLLKAPLIWLCRPKVIEHTDEKIEMAIRLRRRTKNHLGSMYFGALAVGADVQEDSLQWIPLRKVDDKFNLFLKTLRRIL